MKQLKPSCLSDVVNIRRTPIGLAMILMHGFVLAQPALNTTSADVPEAKTLFETDKHFKKLNAEGRSAKVLQSPIIVLTAAEGQRL